VMRCGMDAFHFAVILRQLNQMCFGAAALCARDVAWSPDISWDTRGSISVTRSAGRVFGPAVLNITSRLPGLAT